ncbi:MAG: DUF3795 domain-containing protein [Candidatus Eisenbacteria bacterium]|nr:DUF3795 domain-containing protein [Candidatus Eisenbacteria bacterium]
MDVIVGFCGLVCTDCPAYQATIEDDDAKREAVAKQWSKEYNADIEPAVINCLGCHASDDSVFTHPLRCRIRLCGRERGVESCAYCEEYACRKLEEFFEAVPDARATLDAMRDSR